MKSLLVPIVLSTTVGIGGVVVAPIVTASVTNPDFKPIPPASLETDDWSMIAYWAEKGFDTFKQVYQNDYERNGNTFVGLTKDMTIGNLTYTVMVIDENHDQIANSEKKTTLTLQFKQILSEDISGYPIGSVFGPNAFWSSSFVKEILTTDFQSAVEDVIDRTIPVVQKATYDVPLERDIITNETIFIPSVDEITPNETYCYKYYSDPETCVERRKLVTFTGGYNAYWLRNRLLMLEDTLQACTWDGQTNVGNEYSSSDHIAVIFNI